MPLLTLQDQDPKFVPSISPLKHHTVCLDLERLLAIRLQEIVSVNANLPQGSHETIPLPSRHAPIACDIECTGLLCTTPQQQIAYMLWPLHGRPALNPGS